MFDLLAWLPLLAEEAQQPQQQPPGLGSMLFPFLLIAVVFYFMMIRPQQRQQRQREQMLSELKRNDKVVTIGGVIGTVANISSDGKEVTVKTDETKIRFQRSAIHMILRDDGTTDAVDAAKAAERTG